jgi:carboxyl-terminal processing protease
MLSRRRLSVVLPVLLLGWTVAAYGWGPRKVRAEVSEDSDVAQSLKSFTALFQLVESNFADPVEADTAIYQGAIPGMLQTLDPHSSFLDPKYFALLREEQQGRYYGVGMMVGMRNDRVVVVHPFSNSPAHRAGIRPGDLIASVDGTSAKGFNTSQVADRLKGARGTSVSVTIDREGEEKPLTFAMIRDEIPRRSVPEPVVLQPGVGYIRIEHFNENTGNEVDEALRVLNEENLKGLVLDLRRNPGGLLSEGVAVANRFLKAGQTIVSHRGRASSEQAYVAKGGKRGEYSVVVLVDRGSASASEIVAGALQDHDRAWILGDGTFGKGLVQSQYPLSNQTALLLTTAKYYTPSGRLIQRDYEHKSFFDYYYRRNDNAESKDVRRTDSGRVVFGGGGITPDERFESPRYDVLQATLLRSGAFLGFLTKYLSANKVVTDKGWEPGMETLVEFQRYLADNRIPFEQKAFDQHADWMKEQIRQQMNLIAFGKDEADRLAVTTDPAVRRAVEVLPKAKAPVVDSERMIAERRSKE